MKKLHLKPGLSIFEVLIAVIMIGVSVTTIMGLQGILSRGVFTAHAFIDRICFIKSFLVEADRDRAFEGGKSLKRTVDYPQLTMTYNAAKPTGKRLQTFQNVLVETVEAQWPTPLGQKKELFAQARFTPKGGQ